jgi:hypothetical protein
VRKRIPHTGADGRSLHLHSFASLKVFCRSYGISIDGCSLKADLLNAIDAERLVRAN